MARFHRIGGEKCNARRTHCYRNTTLGYTLSDGVPTIRVKYEIITQVSVALSVDGSLSDSRVSMFRRLVASVTRLHVRGAPLGALIPALALVASPRRLHACRLGRGRDVRRFPEKCVEAVHARLWAHGQYACDSPPCRPSPLSRLPDVRGLMMSRWLPASRSRADHRQQGEPEVFQAVLHQGDVRREPPLCARGH